MENIIKIKSTSRFLEKYGIYIGLLVIVITFSIISPYFLTQRNLFNIIVQSAIISIVAIGQTVIITSAGIDLSVGSVIAFVGMALAMLLVAEVPIFIAIIISLIIGTFIGFLNGIIISYGKVPAFIMTLGMMSIARGGTLALSGGQPISRLPRSFGMIAGARIFNIPIFILYVLVLYLIMYLIMNKSRLGRYFYAIGDNMEASRLSGIKVKKIQTITYMFGGFFAAVGAIMLISRMNYASPTAAQGYELDAIAAVVIGGTALSGGKGNIMGTLVGSLILGTLRNGLSIMNVAGFYQQIIIGTVIIIAVFIDKLRS